MSKTVVTITGIRPDFIRMAYVFKKLDREFNHILIHTGQHYDELLSGSFFRDLDIRKPDYTLESGKQSNNHYEQLAYLSVSIPELFKKYNIRPDLIIFLGDSNSVCAALPLKKEGYKIAHIEAGMRSFDDRMLEEINRTVCDKCSCLYYVYHNDYRQHLINENIDHRKIHVVGNTIVEPCLHFIRTQLGVNNLSNTLEWPVKRNDMILMDIHRPENFNDIRRLEKIINFGKLCLEKYKLPIKLLYFKRLKDSLDRYNIDFDGIEMIDLMPYNEYLKTSYHSLFVISDSGSACEELPLIKTPVVVPREYTERPQSYLNNCSVQLPIDKWNSNTLNDDCLSDVFDFIDRTHKFADLSWLYPIDNDKSTSTLIVESISNYFKINK